MPLMTSINFMTGAGLKKCMPMTLSGRFVAAPIWVIARDEVLDARIVCSGQSSSSSLKIADLIFKSSIAASTTRSMSFMLSAVRVTKPETRAMVASLSSWVILPLETCLVSCFSILALPPAMNSSLISFKTTSQPCVAKTCAMPEPIVPAPITITLLMFNSSFVA